MRKPSADSSVEVTRYEDLDLKCTFSVTIYSFYDSFGGLSVGIYSFAFVVIIREGQRAVPLVCLHLAEIFEAHVAGAFVDFCCVVNLQAVSNDAFSVAVLVVAIIAMNHDLIMRLFVVLQILYGQKL